MSKVKGIALCAAAALLLTPTLAHGNGFALFEHGARGVGMGGAFGATANDPSAGYYNPAGLAFLEGMQSSAGAYLITETSKFTGDDPYPGAGYKAELEHQIFYPLHLHVTGDLAKNLRWGISTTAPFGLGTWWPDDYAGKFITKRVDLKVLNLNPNLAYKVSDNFAVAVGFDYFLSQVDITKSIGVINPYTQQVAEVGQVHLFTPDWETGSGWNAGILWKIGGGFSFGATYRSRVEMKYSDAEASFVQFGTGYADFDAIVAGLLPFGDNVPGTSEIVFPAEMRYAVAWHNDVWTVEADFVRMGWDTFETLPITIEGRPDLSSVRAEDYVDRTTFRFGVEWKTSDRWAWQFGYLDDPTPVPTASVSPLLPDSDRTGYSVGFTWDWTNKMQVQSSFLYLPFDDRSTDGQDHDNYNGSYETTAYLWGFSLVYRF